MGDSDLDLRIWRGDAKGGELVSYRVPVTEGMVVLDEMCIRDSRSSATKPG